jgi:hypothetical protein
MTERPKGHGRVFINKEQRDRVLQARDKIRDSPRFRSLLTGDDTKDVSAICRVFIDLGEAEAARIMAEEKSGGRR